MPYAKRKRSMSRRPVRRTLKRRRRIYSRRSARMTSYPVPRFKTVKMKYSETISINPGAGTLASNSFLMNGLYDPNTGGTGHQPLGYDEWANFYQRYCVTKCSMKVTFVNDSASTYRVGITRAHSGISSTVDTLIEGDSTVSTILCANTGGNNVKTLTMPLNAHKFFNKRQLAVVGNEFTPLFSANPSATAYGHVWAIAADGASDPAAIIVHVQLIFTAVLLERKILVQS